MSQDDQDYTSGGGNGQNKDLSFSLKEFIEAGFGEVKDSIESGRVEL